MCSLKVWSFSGPLVTSVANQLMARLSLALNRLRFAIEHKRFVVLLTCIQWSLAHGRGPQTNILMGKDFATITKRYFYFFVRSESHVAMGLLFMKQVRFENKWIISLVAFLKRQLPHYHGERRIPYCFFWGRFDIASPYSFKTVEPELHYRKTMVNVKS